MSFKPIMLCILDGWKAPIAKSIDSIFFKYTEYFRKRSKSQEIPQCNSAHCDQDKVSRSLNGFTLPEGMGGVGFEVCFSLSL